MLCRRIVLLLTCTIFGGTLLAQDVEEDRVGFPESDIFLFDLELSGETALVSNGQNVTATAGYENQPCFTSDSRSFLFSKSVDSQTDIFEYFLNSKETKQITASACMEFSPIPSPDNQFISFVTDGEGANQSIWQLNRDAPDKPEWVLRSQPEREPVGYYSWNHETGHMLFWSRYGFNIRLVHESKQLSHYVTGDAVPTTPQIIPGTQNFSFVHRQGNGEVWIKELNPTTKAIRPLTPVAGSNSHYGWAPDGSILMIEDAKLHRWKPDSKKGWQEIAQLNKQGIESATRLNVSPDGKRLAIVGVPVK